MTQSIKVGVIGSGFIGPAHIEALRRQGIEVLGIADANQELADKAAAQLYVPKAYGNWEDLVSDPEIDVIHITSPNYLHYKHTKAALEADKHVICEKPLTMNSKESIELINLAKEKRLLNAVNYNLRFYPLSQEAHELVKAGRLGDSIYIIQGSYLQDWLLYDTDWNWRIEPGLGGDLRAIGDIGSHWIDLLTFITGLKIKSVMADCATFLPIRKKPKKKIDTFNGKIQVDQEYEKKKITTEDYASILLDFENDARGVLTVSQVSSGRKNRLFYEINGSESSLFWNSEIPNQLEIGNRQSPNELIIKDPTIMSEGARWAASYPGGHAEGYPDTFKQLQKAFYGYLRSDRKNNPNFPTFEDGHNVILVEEAIHKSLQKNQWVNVEY